MSNLPKVVSIFLNWKKLQTENPFTLNSLTNVDPSAVLGQDSKSVPKHFCRTHTQIKYPLASQMGYLFQKEEDGCDACFWLHIDTTKALGKHEYPKLLFTVLCCRVEKFDKTTALVRHSMRSESSSALYQNATVLNSRYIIRHSKH